MSDLWITVLVLGVLVVTVLSGIHIAVALGIASLLGIWLVTGDISITIDALASTAFEGLRGYVFIALPLFMLMGEFISRSGAAQDLYVGINRALRGLPGRLALATVLGNAVFAFLTGVSIAAAAAFTRIAYPQMKRFGYDRPLALAVIAGSSCLGMLIPPSNLMILWAILTEGSIGRIFLAGIVPGLLLITLLVLFVILAALIRPQLFGEPGRVGEHALDVVDLPDHAEGSDMGGGAVGARDILISSLSVGGIIVCVLGGLWFGAFTATEAAGVGVLLALFFGIVVKGMRWPIIREGVLQVGRTAAPLMLMILMALFYSRALALTGIGSVIEDFFLDGGFSKWTILGFMVGVWFLLGMVIDSKSIMLLTVPIFAPLGDVAGFDPVAFAIIGILAIEAGLLTPPFGLIVYTVKASTDGEDEDVTILSIFKAAIPFWIMLLIVMMLVAIWPSLATGLGDRLF